MIDIRVRRSAAVLSIALHLVVILLLLALWRPYLSTDHLAKAPLLVSLEPLPPAAPAEPAPSDIEKPATLAKPAAERLNTVELPAFTSSPEPTVTSELSAPGVVGPGIAATEMSGNDSAPATEQDGASSSREPEMEGPDWLVRPTAGQMLEVLPQGMREGQISGGAVLSCLVTANNMVRACKVLDETKGTYGFGNSYEFGKSARRLSRYFRVRPPMRDGQPRYDIPVRIPVYWKGS